MSHTFNDQTPGAEITRLFPERVRGKTCLKRGELAAATADALAAAQASTIICTGHCQAELQPVIDHINRKLCHAIKKIGLPIDGFIGFPSVMAAPWETTIDGFESHFQKNYLCYFLLVNLILDVMAPGSRIVLVTSSLRTEAPAPTWVGVGFSDYHCLNGYSQSMLAVILFVKSLSKMCGGRLITAFSANPGNTKTNIQTLFLLIAIVQPGNILSAGEDIPVLLQQAPKSLAQGSATILRGLLDPDLEEQSGSFLDHCQTLTLPHLDFPAGQDSAAALWERSQGFLKQFL
ncbi:unnamed protein product [Penicillium salamii]|uniref:Uncharacterized protein n=1 Tax=Penicillium salamii TaxID=1612424 RepID=A0A9W4NFF8_9EURO|nr:unnamed protein product [Penicillium salamii]